MLIALASLRVHKQRNFYLRVFVVLESLSHVPFVATHVFVRKSRVLDSDILVYKLELNNILNPVLELLVGLIERKGVRFTLLGYFILHLLIVLVHIEHKQGGIVFHGVVFEFNFPLLIIEHVVVVVQGVRHEVSQISDGEDPLLSVEVVHHRHIS